MLLGGSVHEGSQSREEQRVEENNDCGHKVYLGLFLAEVTVAGGSLPQEVTAYITYSIVRSSLICGTWLGTIKHSSAVDCWRTLECY